MNRAAREQLRQLLTTDPQFRADMEALGLGNKNDAVVPKVLDGNRRFEQLGQEHMPCWMNDAGDMTGESSSNEGGGLGGMTIGSTQQEWAGDIELALVWIQQDHVKSVMQTDLIPHALVRLLLRNPSLGETCTYAYAAEIQADRSYRHPTHVLYARLRVHTVIERDA